MDKQSGRDWDKAVNVVGELVGVAALFGIGWGLHILHDMGELGATLAWAVPIVAMLMGCFYAFARWYSTRQAWVSPEMTALMKAEEEKV